MNYLTHFYFNTQQPVYNSVSEYFHFGVVFPDILSVYDRSLRFHSEDASGLPDDFWMGIRNHLQMDIFFHKSEFFKTSYEQIRRHLTAAIPLQLDIRPFFLAHVIVEILLDHYLLNKNPDLALKFYSQLLKCDVKQIVTSTEKHFSLDLIGLGDLIHKFLVTRFLEGYIELNNLIYPVNRMLMRTHQQVFELNDPELIQNILKPSLSIVSVNIPMLMQEFNKEFLNSQY
jgi:acyl carrier protein phosphodiesterase